MRFAYRILVLVHARCSRTRIPEDGVGELLLDSHHLSYRYRPRLAVGGGLVRRLRYTSPW